MKLRTTSLLALALIAGCSGTAPAGNENGRVEEMKQATLQQKIDDINRAPIPPEEKQKQIEKLKADAGQSGGETKVTGYGNPNADPKTDVAQPKGGK